MGDERLGYGRMNTTQTDCRAAVRPPHPALSGTEARAMPDGQDHVTVLVRPRPQRLTLGPCAVPGLQVHPPQPNSRGHGPVTAR